MIGGIGNASQMSSRLFSALDTKSQGYLEKSDFVSAFSKISNSSNSSSSSSTSVDDVFSALDSDSDGKVTESEFASTLSKLQEELDGQFNQMRMQGQGGHGGPQGMGGMPPPPPQGNDAGFTKDELSSQLEEIGSSDSQRSSLISKVVDNFEAADTDQDGKVSFSEAMAYDQSTQQTGTSDSSDTSSASTSAAASSSASNSDAQIMFKIMQLMHAYGNPAHSGENSAVSSLLSVTA